MKSLILVFTIVWLAACSRSVVDPQNPEDTQRGQLNLASNANGATSGGGHEVKENSLPLLNYLKTTMVGMFERAAPSAFADLPNGWTVNDIIEVIQNISEIDDSHRRSTAELMFDYTEGVNGSKGRVYATQWYFITWASFPYRNYERTGNLRGLVFEDEVQGLIISIFHEISHLILNHGPRGRNLPNEQADEEAKQLAFQLLNTLERDFIICKASDVRLKGMKLRESQKRARSDAALVFNLPFLRSGEVLDYMDNIDTLLFRYTFEDTVLNIASVFDGSDTWGVMNNNDMSTITASSVNDVLRLNIERDTRNPHKLEQGIFHSVDFPFQALATERFSVEVLAWEKPPKLTIYNSVFRQLENKSETFQCTRYNLPWNWNHRE